MSQKHTRQWRLYRTRAGRSPVKDFIEALDDTEAAEVHAAMKEVREDGLLAARHLRGDIHEVVADCATRTVRVLFATEGRFNQVLLGVAAFVKKTRKTPPGMIVLAEKRLRDWRERGHEMRRVRKPIQ